MTDNYDGIANRKMRYMLIMAIMEGDPLARDVYRDWLMDMDFSETGADAATSLWETMRDTSSKQEIHGWLEYFKKQLKILEEKECTGQSN